MFGRRLPPVSRDYLMGNFTFQATKIRNPRRGSRFLAINYGGPSRDGGGPKSRISNKYFSVKKLRINEFIQGAASNL